MAHTMARGLCGLAIFALPLQAALAQSADSTATFFQDCNFGGYAVSLPEGSYDGPALQARGIRNDDISSIQVFNGYKVTLYADTGFQGRAVTYTQRDTCMVNENFNDIATSLKIEKIAATQSNNPIFPGWYADPEARIFGKEYWVYPTTSVGYDQQTYLDAFSSTDLVHWTKHAKVLDKVNVSWATRAMWAPSVVEKNGKYYLFFGANDIQNDSQPGGIGVAVADKPEGPFKDLIGRPLINKIQNGAQPIDQMVYRDTDGQYYMYYGGWGHCNVVKLNDSFTGIVAFPDGTLYKEITPSGYTEGSFMIRRNGKYYFMWSEGYWGGPDYSVSYAMADSPIGPFTRIGKILQQDASIANGAGHHSVIQLPGEDKWYIVYHRRPLDQTDGNSRETSIERLEFDANGYIKPVKLTNEGVPAQTVTYPGLTAQYYNGMDFQTLVGTRIDRAINFNWGDGSPLAGVNADGFSVRWTGKIVPRYSERYTFFMNTDNGRRLWINNQLVIDRWTDDWGVEYNGAIQLQAGQAYDIRVEYFENWGGASARLEWSSSSQPREVVERFQP